MAAKFEKLKLPSYGQMGPVAFPASDAQIATGDARRVLLFGGQRSGISGAMYSFEQTSGEGFVAMAEQAEGEKGPPPAPRTQASLTSIGEEDKQTTLILFGGFALNIGCVNDAWKCVVEIDPDHVSGAQMDEAGVLRHDALPTLRSLGHVPRHEEGQNCHLWRDGHAAAVRRPVHLVSRPGGLVAAGLQGSGTLAPREAFGDNARRERHHPLLRRLQQGRPRDE